MPSSDGQADRGRVKPIPGDLDNFFAWVQDTDLAKGPVKETLHLIESKHRKAFEVNFEEFVQGQEIERTRGPLEVVFKKESSEFKEQHKSDIALRISYRRNLLINIERLEKYFVETFRYEKEYKLTPPFRPNKDFELAIVEKRKGAAPVNWQEAVLISDLKRMYESVVESDEEYLRQQKKYKKPASFHTWVLREIADFLFRHDCNPAHALEFTKLLICHDTNVWPKDEKLAKEYRALMAKYGVPLKRKPRVRH